MLNVFEHPEPYNSVFIFGHFSRTRYVTGGLLAPAWPACVAAVSSWFPDSRLNTIFGFINTSTFCGGLAGTTLAAAITEYSGWRSVGFYPALIASLAALLVSMFLLSPEEKGLSVPGKVIKAAESKTEQGHDDSLLEISRYYSIYGTQTFSKTEYIWYLTLSLKPSIIGFLSVLTIRDNTDPGSRVSVTSPPGCSASSLSATP